jgi:tetratricopeptide (TPR) repeat protein
MALRVVMLALTLLASVAQAEDKPWAAGKSKAEQDAAFAKYDEANNLFAEGEYTRALEAYDAAIGLWDHPGIRYNRAICLINLDRPVEALKDLTEAMKYGEEPLGKDLYIQGVSYKKLLSKQVAEVEITTKEKGAKVSLDGKPLSLAGGRVTKMLIANDSHEVIASKPGYQTSRHPLDRLPAGGKTTVEIKLQPLEGGKWKPWAVMAGGAVLSAVGVGVYMTGRREIDRYEKAVANTCPCTDETDLETRGKLPHDLPGSSRKEQIIGISAIAVGGATFATGIALVVRGRGRTSVAPAVGKDSASVSFSGSW